MGKSLGVIAVFKNESDIMKAARAAREQKKYKKYDVFTPYPVHGMDDAMGLKRSFLPWVTFFAGATGFCSAVALQGWTSAVDWPINIGGKPFFSLPAFVPIIFELTVLFAGLATVGALFFICGLPNLKAKILHPDITKDKFVLFVPSNEESFNENDVTQFLKGLHPEEVTVVSE
ncbi:MAG: DUF3341 domain-containing protein [Oligoflexia bacterium]|nr:DUF3341 domain-containing protein [Oligoflexia bacterium]